MTVNRPQPRPGVLDIAPYVPGKSTAPGVAKVFKLSSNETPLGPSANAIAAYRAAGEHLEDYPDGSAVGLARSNRRRVRARSRPHRLRRRLRRSAQSARARLSQRWRRGDLHDARLSRLPDRDHGHRGEGGCRAGKEFYRECGCHSRRRSRQRRKSSSWPIRTIRPEPMFRSTRSSGCKSGCRRTCCSCSMPPTRNTCSATTTNPASNWLPRPTTW